MGTFDSVYLNKIRLLEEENQQLKNILNEYFAPAFFGKSPEEIAQLRKPKNPFEKFESGPPMSPEERQKRRESATRLYREMRKRGDLPKIIERKPIMSNPPEQAPIDGRDVYRRTMAGRGDGSYMPLPSKRNAGLRINDARPEPAPYPSDDMESRRAAEAERAEGERLRNELRGGGPQYRRTPPKSDLSFW